MCRGIHLISNDQWNSNELVTLFRDIHPYIHFIHIREKQKSPLTVFRMIERIIEEGVPADKIIINDRADLALVSGTKGVHLGERSLPVEAVKQSFPEFMIGRSVHDLNGAIKGVHSQADYIVYGHVFPTMSKSGLKAKGIDALKEIVQAVSIPVIPVGGIKPDHIEQISRTGAAGLAVMSGIFDASHPLKASRDYFEAYQTFFERRDDDEADD